MLRLMILGVLALASMGIYAQTQEVFYFLTDEEFGTTLRTIDQDKSDSISLGKLPCGQSLNLQLDQLGQNQFHSLPCHGQESFIWGFMSDTQIKQKKHRERAQEIVRFVEGLQQRYDISLLLNAGDTVHRGDRLEEWHEYFTVSQPLLKQRHLVSAFGNHEYYETQKGQSESLLAQQFLRVKDQLSYYALDFKHWKLIVLNSNFKYISSDVEYTQRLWLEAQLIRATIMDQTVMIIMHHSPFSSSLEHIRPIPRKLRDAYVPLFEKYKKQVKLVLSGHLHMFERSKKTGIHYLTAGPSGGIYNFPSYKNPYKKVLIPSVMTVSLLKFNKKELEVETYNSAGHLIDYFQL